MPTTITLSDVARWVIEDDGTARFIYEGNAAAHRVSVGPIPWTERHIGDLVVYMLGLGHADPTRADVLDAGAAMVGYPLGGKTWKVPAPFRIEQAITGVRQAPVTHAYSGYPLRFGYVVQHKYGWWLALDKDLHPITNPAGERAEARTEGLYAAREEAVHRVITAYRPQGPDARHEAITRGSALYEEAMATYRRLELLQTLLREQGQPEQAGTLDLPIQRAFKHAEGTWAAVENILQSRTYPTTA